MFDRHVIRASMSDVPVRIEKLVCDGEQKCSGCVGVYRGERREWILRSRRAEGVGKQDPGQAHRGTERRVLHKIVIKPREGLDIKQSPTAANGRRMRAVIQRVRKAETRREISGVVVDAAGRESGIARE